MVVNTIYWLTKTARKCPKIGKSRTRKDKIDEAILFFRENKKNNYFVYGLTYENKKLPIYGLFGRFRLTSL